MIITFADKHKKDLQFLTTLSSDILSEFCRISLEFLRKGANKKIFGPASQKLGVPIDVVTHVVEGLAHLLTESSRYLLSEADFIASLVVLNFPEAINNQLKDLYVIHRKEIRTILYELYPHLPHYVDLDWRLDVQLASRTLRGQTIDPVFILHLKTTSTETKNNNTDNNNEDKDTSQYLQADPHHIKHLTSELEAALQEIRANDVRRVMRNIK
eukprot:TRINITY_DN2634_c0_g1_i1.p1 TRINITY_DN2634_c0_g1~~TRINITY_DN2634_c0_g1_i1.p1  ORF type:complete len:213 (+),score=36.46 TRINITY_DN2634_c0_g1_i1:169-807(+)